MSRPKRTLRRARAPGMIAAIAQLGLLLALGPAAAQNDVDAFDGSYRLQTGEVVTGGYFVEGGEGRYLYMDTENLEKGGLFERVSDTTMRSVIPPGAVEVDFVRGVDGEVEGLVWRERGMPAVRGVRVRPHDSLPVSFRSRDGTELSGRLLTPRCPGPHPTVVVVHGSGPVDRHGGPYHTFFLQHGVAVLAYDKRGFTTDPQVWREPALEVLSDDAAAALSFAATLPQVDDGRLGFFGSSQAGWVVPRAAALEPGAEFLILRAGAGTRNLETVLHEQRQELRAAGVGGLDLDDAVGLWREVYEAAVRGETVSAAARLVSPYLEEPWYRAAFGAAPIAGRWSAAAWERLGRNLAVDPEPELERYEGPVLWFLGERDENVPLLPTRAALERAFAASPGAPQEVVVLPDAPHSFLISGVDGEVRFSDGFFDRMASWMEATGISRGECVGGGRLER
jgi:uncharacterized protein